ncbi:hypothetical protein BEH94_04250 [Candidatus Altiarchaeales archaeon WOR_SM1_SCG]|nr:hypothetical protein BEH94_04250 [Candidatus Altiarchaeales archaeon WOR_SM1_SCG]ODS37669.1 MAG: hypothetical protein A7315_13270 [Candidatus Altiarchaeales archaeon WOR_SM1_79]
MKITAKNSGILLAIIGIFLIAGCIGETQDNKQAELEDKQSAMEDKHSELEDKQSAMEDKQAELEERQDELEDRQAELEDKQSAMEDKQTELEDKFSEELNKTGSGKEEPGEDRNWCNADSAERYGSIGEAIWVEGVVEFKGMEMCHIRFFSIAASGKTQNDWYFTKNDEEIYSVTTHPDGRVEERRVV